MQPPKIENVWSLSTMAAAMVTHDPAAAERAQTQRHLDKGRLA